jgi:hypothetical protein
MCLQDDADDERGVPASPYTVQEAGLLLTPKFGKESDLWVRLDEESVWWKEKIFSVVFGKEICGRLSAPVRQRNSRADFAGLDGDMAQAGRANG